MVEGGWITHDGEVLSHIGLVKQAMEYPSLNSQTFVLFLISHCYYCQVSLSLSVEGLEGSCPFKKRLLLIWCPLWFTWWLWTASSLNFFYYKYQNIYSLSVISIDHMLTECIWLFDGREYTLKKFPLTLTKHFSSLKVILAPSMFSRTRLLTWRFFAWYPEKKYHILVGCNQFVYAAVH